MKNLNLTPILDNLQTNVLLSYHSSAKFPTTEQLVEMVDTFKIFSNQSKDCMGKCIYRKEVGKNEVQPTKFDYREDVSRAMVDYYITHPTDETIKYSHVIRYVFQPLLEEIVNVFSHSEFLDNLDEICATLTKSINLQESLCEEIVDDAYIIPEYQKMAANHHLDKQTKVFQQAINLMR